MTSVSDSNLAKVLFVEDSLGDIDLTKAILRKSKLHMDLEIIRDGEAVVDYIKDRKTDATPDLILLDFNLPKRNGLEVLKAVRENTPTKDIPVIMLSGSDSPNDMEMASFLGSVGYLVKPLNKERLQKIVDGIDTLELVAESDGTFLRTIPPLAAE